MSKPFIGGQIDTGGGAKRLDDLGRAVKARVLRKAVNASTAPMLKAVKSQAKTLAYETGTLAKSLGRVVRTYRESGLVIGYVGRRTGIQYRREVTLRKDRVFRMNRQKRRYRILKPTDAQRTMIRDPRYYQHLAIKHSNYMHQGYQAGLPASRDAMINKISVETQNEARKLASKGQ